VPTHLRCLCAGIDFFRHRLSRDRDPSFRVAESRAVRGAVIPEGRRARSRCHGRRRTCWACRLRSSRLNSLWWPGWRGYDPVSPTTPMRDTTNPPAGGALDGHRNTSAGLAPYLLQHGVARLSVDLNAGCRLERLGVSALLALRRRPCEIPSMRRWDESERPRPRCRPRSRIR
jgi:hypothetical protein